MTRHTIAQYEVLEDRRLLANSLAWGFGWGFPEVMAGATSVAVDSGGNTYVTGVFRGKVDVNPSKSKALFLNSKGSKDDVFVCKYTSAGQLKWAHRMGSVGIDTADTLALGPDGSVYVGGTFRDQGEFGFGSNAITLTGKGGMDGYIVKLSAATGAVVWGGSFGGSRDDQMNSIAVGAGGELYLSGIIRLSGDINPTGKVNNITCRGTDDNFIERLNPSSGAVMWSKAFGENNTIETVRRMSVAADGGVVAAGFFNETLQLDRSSSKYNVTAVGWYDVYLLKIDGDGDFDWATSFGGKKQETVGDMTMSPGGDIYVTGNFVKTLDIGKQHLGTDFETQAYIAKFNGNGKNVWAKDFGSEGNVVPTAIAVGADGNVYSAGTFDDQTEFDTGTGSKLFTVEKDDAGILLDQESPTDVYISELSGSGDFVTAFRFGGLNGSAAVKDMAADSSGGLILAGQFANVININPFTGKKKLLRTRDDNEESDVLVMKIRNQVAG